MNMPVFAAPIGSTINYRGNECLVLEHRNEGALLMATKHISKSFGSSNNFSNSSLRSHLNGDYLKALTGGNPDEIITRTVDMTAANGSTEYGSCEAKVAPLTLDEMRKYHAILPKPERWGWLVTPWSTPNVDEDDTWVAGLNTSGSLGDRNCTGTLGCRPAFLVSLNLLIECGTNPLEQFSTRELAEEIIRRSDRD